MNGEVRKLYDDARREGRSSPAWLVLADRLVEAGHHHLARRLSRAVRGWSRLERGAEREGRALTGPRGTSPRGALGLELNNEWSQLRHNLDRLFARTPTAADRAQVRRAARAVATAKNPAERHQRALALASVVDATGWPWERNIVPTGLSGPPERWQVRTLDVWGNEEDGFDVNDRFNAGTIELPTELAIYNASAYRDSYIAGYRTTIREQPLLMLVTTETVAREGALERMLRRDYLAPRARIDISYSGPDFIEVEQRSTGRPLLHLERLEGDDEENA